MSTRGTTLSANPHPRQSVSVRPKDVEAASSLADWLKGYDMGEVVVSATYGTERFRVRWDTDGLRIIFPGEENGNAQS